MKSITSRLIGLFFISFKLMAYQFEVAAIEFNPKILEFDKNIPNLIKITEEAAIHGAKLIVLPELATTGLNYQDRQQIQPFLDTIPGKTTARFEQLTKKYNTYVVVGIAEIDKDSQLAYNAAALIGPEGYIGKYRKNGLNTLDQHWAAAGNLGFPVFETTLGKIALLICYDNTYLEYLLLPALRGADIIAFIADPGQLLKNQRGAFLNHSTIANITTLSGWIGTYIIASSRTGLEVNPSMPDTEIYFDGGASIWGPNGEHLAQAPATHEPSLDHQTHIIYATVNSNSYQNNAKRVLKHRRRPELYGVYNLARTPVDLAASSVSKHINALLLQYTPIPGQVDANLKKIERLMKNNHQQADLIVLPEDSLIGPIKTKEMRNYAENLHGSSVKKLADIAKKYHAYLVFSMPEKQENHYYHSAIILNDRGKIQGIYRKAHLNAQEKHWASPGQTIPVFLTALGRIGIILGDEVRIPDIANILAMKRVDLIVVPTAWSGEYGSKIEMAPELPLTTFPKNTMTFWYNIARYAQAYTLIANYVGGTQGFLGSSAIYALDPVEAKYAPQVASATEELAFPVSFDTLGSMSWWMNQTYLILGKRTELHPPLTLDNQSACFKAWQSHLQENQFCWHH